MNMKNLEFLKDQLKYTGFGEGFDSELRQKIDKGLAEFQINHRAEFGKDVVSATLNYTKSASSDMYFLNNYKVDLKPENTTELMSQIFRIGKENNITLKEAYNLMNGRAIYKQWTKIEKQGEGESARYVVTDEKYHAWKQMNFKETDKVGNFKFDTYSDNYGFKPEVLIQQLPLKELENEVQSKWLIDSMLKGNRQQVTLLINGEQQQGFVVANPQFKKIDTYDANMKKIKLDHGLENGNVKTRNEAVNQSETKSKKGRTIA